MPQKLSKEEQKSYAEKEKYIPNLMHKVADKTCCKSEKAEKPRQKRLSNFTGSFKVFRYETYYFFKKLVKFHTYSSTKYFECSFSISLTSGE